MYKLAILRHGESQWNLSNRFTGWTDVGLTQKGFSEAKEAGQLFKDAGFTFTEVYTSVLKRANLTMDECLKKLSLKNISIKYDWRLNERHYGKLQGLNKAETALKYGDEQVLIWRRSYNLPPPSLNINDKQHPRFDKKYSKIDSSLLPSSESLKDTKLRFITLWEDEISSSIKNGGKILIVAHGNSIRALIKHLDNVSDDDIVNINIPTGVPLIYELNKDLNAINHYYLGNQNAIESKIASVADQGKSK